jgi:hypothetical protein
MDPKSNSARRYINYFMHHINLLRHYKVVPVVVFDGCSMPCKAATDDERRRYANSVCDASIFGYLKSFLSAVLDMINLSLNLQLLD